MVFDRPGQLDGLITHTGASRRSFVAVILEGGRVFWRGDMRVLRRSWTMGLQFVDTNLGRLVG